MRNRAMGLSALFVLSLVVTACGGTSADIKKVGLVTDVGTLEDKSFNEASWVGAQAGAKDIGGTASNIVTKAPADYATNIKTFVDQGYGTIVTVGFAMGDATTAAAKQYPNVKFIGVDQGVCIDETGKCDPKFACKGDPKKLLPNYQGLVFKEEQVGYLAGVARGQRLEVGRHRHRRRHQHDPGGRPLHQRLSQRRRVGRDQARERQGRLRLDRHHQGLQRPGHRQVDRPADDRPEGRRDLPGRRAVRRRRDRGGLRHAGRHRHRRRRRPVEVAAAVGQVHPDERREEAGRRRRRPRSRRSGPRPTSAAPPSGTPRPPRSASACRRTAATTRTSSPRRSRPRSTRPSPG